MKNWSRVERGSGVNLMHRNEFRQVLPVSASLGDLLPVFRPSVVTASRASLLLLPLPLALTALLLQPSL